MAQLEIEKKLRALGVNNEINLTTPPKSEMGDFAFACFEIAKNWQISPVDAAKKIQSDLSFGRDSLVIKAQAFGPYVNFFLDSSKLTKSILSKIKKQNNSFGFNKTGNGKTVLIEYPSNNTHKELHVGHLRNICIGNALVQIFKANGYKVIPVNYLNDFGSHVAKCLWGIKKFYPQEVDLIAKDKSTIAKTSQAKQKLLGEIYARASQYLNEHEDAKTEVYDLQKKLEAHDKTIWPLYQTTRAWSIKRFNEVFSSLGVVHKTVFYEHNTKDAGQKIVGELLKKGIAQIGEGGAIIIDLTKENLDIGLLRKSNGAGLYLTSDLGLAVAKNKKYPKVCESIHLTGTEQNFYFKQLFKILERAGYRYKMTHIGYGLVSTPSGKMSSRLGNVILYDDIYSEVYEKVLAETAKRHQDWNKNKISKNSEILALAAIKFEFLKHEAEKGIVFDSKSATSFDGFTGPYALYTVARIASIMRKMKIKKSSARDLDYELLKTEEEKRLALKLDNYTEIIKKALADYNPSTLTRYIFELAQLYNDFYNKCSVVNAGDKKLSKARLDLSIFTRQTLISALGQLSIKTVEEM